MKTIYVDWNIFAKESNWPNITALSKTARIVISDWQMVELAGGTDRAQAFKRADFIDSLNPLWMIGYLPIQQHELKDFVWRHYFKVPPTWFLGLHK